MVSGQLRNVSKVKNLAKFREAIKADETVKRFTLLVRG